MQIFRQLIRFFFSFLFSHPSHSFFNWAKKKEEKEISNTPPSFTDIKESQQSTFFRMVYVSEKKNIYIYSSPPTLNRVFIKVLISGTIKGPKSGSKWTMTLASPLAFVVPLSFSIVHRQKISSSTLYFTILPQGMTFRPCCLDILPAVFPTFWWGGIWPGASVNAILSRSTPTTEPRLFPLFLRRPFFSCLVPYPRQWRPPLRFSLSLSCSLFWFACYKIESIRKMDRWWSDFADRLVDRTKEGSVR